MRMIALRITMPASAIMPIMPVAVNQTGLRCPPTSAAVNRLSSQKPGMIPMMPSGIEAMITSGMKNEWVSTTSSA